jgi:hypothetical protein
MRDAQGRFSSPPPGSSNRPRRRSPSPPWRRTRGATADRPPPAPPAARADCRTAGQGLVVAGASTRPPTGATARRAAWCVPSARRASPAAVTSPTPATPLASARPVAPSPAVLPAQRAQPACSAAASSTAPPPAAPASTMAPSAPWMCSPAASAAGAIASTRSGIHRTARCAGTTAAPESSARWEGASPVLTAPPRPPGRAAPLRQVGWEAAARAPASTRAGGARTAAPVASRARATLDASVATARHPTAGWRSAPRRARARPAPTANRAVACQLHALPRPRRSPALSGKPGPSSPGAASSPSAPAPAVNKFALISPRTRRTAARAEQAARRVAARPASSRHRPVGRRMAAQTPGAAPGWRPRA